MTSLTSRFVVLSALVALVAACGSSDSGTSSGSSGGTSSSTTSLKSMPTTDASKYDPSASSSSSSESVEPSKSLSKSVSKSATVGAAENKYDTRHVVNEVSRIGCEANAHKDQIIMDAQTATLDRCYLEAVERSGIAITDTNKEFIPTSGKRVYGFLPPSDSDSEKANKCAGIPAERTAEKAACLAGEGAASGAIAVKLGLNSAGSLEIEVCSGKTLSALKKESESVYTGGTTPTFSVTRIGNHGGTEEKGHIEGTFKGLESPEDGTLKDEGSATITGSMIGRFGKGKIILEANKLNAIIQGGFVGVVKDPFSSNAEASFTAKAWAIMGKAKSTDAKQTGYGVFSGTGSMLPMPLRNIIPFGIGAQMDNFLKLFCSEMGITFNGAVCSTSNLDSIFICPNPSFDHENPAVSVKPMVSVARGAACGEVTHTGKEGFEILNIQKVGNFGKFTRQTFKVIADADVPASFKTLGDAVDLAKVSADPGTIAFAMDWDCSGVVAERTLNLADISTLSAAQQSKLSALSEAMAKCAKLEEDGRGRGGHGDNRCGGQELGVVAKNIQKDPPSSGNAGGQLVKLSTTCNPPISTAVPNNLFINVNSAADKKYCLPTPSNGCKEFTVSASTVSGLSIPLSSQMSITQIVFSGASDGAGVTTKANQAVLSLTVSGGGQFQDTTCAATYEISSPESGFTAQTQAPATSTFPEKCKANGITEQEACHQFCQDPRNGCFPTM